VVKGINVKAPTPLWMKEKLRRCGIRSIDAVVDVTNYVLLELGQPMHAFDKDRIEGGIVVRMAKEGETLVLLDGTEAKLNADTLVIADHSKALAMGGIFGGEHSASTTKRKTSCWNARSSARFPSPVAHAVTACTPMRLTATSAAWTLRCSTKRWSVRLAC
jgi:phenylalanyl-tRNA synthetase beta subunit